MAEPKRILFLASNPGDTGRLRFDKEHNEISKALKMAKNRDQYTLDQAFAVSSRDISRKILEVKPNIVHFTGHGTERGKFVAEDEGKRQLIHPTALGGLMKAFRKNIELVFLNSCYSDERADEILKYIPYVIGMRDKILDATAIEFAIGVYDAMGDGEFEFSPESLEWAVDYAKATAHMEGATDFDLPIFRFNAELVGEKVKGNSPQPGRDSGSPQGESLDLASISLMVVKEGLRPAADALFELMQRSSFGRKDNDIIHLVGRINGFHRDVQGGILRAQEQQVREAQLRASFNALMDELKDN